MTITKLLLSLFSAALLLAANFGIVYEVSVGSETLPGTFSRTQLKNGANTAGDIAEEISRGPAGSVTYTRRARLSLAPPSGDERDFVAAVLGEVNGVVRAWQVSVDGEPVGICSDSTAFSEMLETMLAQRASVEAVAVDFMEDITLDAIFTSEDGIDELSDIALALRGVTQVMSTAANGAVRYG